MDEHFISITKALGELARNPVWEPVVSKIQKAPEAMGLYADVLGRLGEDLLVQAARQLSMETNSVTRSTNLLALLGAKAREINPQAQQCSGNPFVTIWEIREDKITTIEPSDLERFKKKYTTNKGIVIDYPRASALISIVENWEEELLRRHERDDEEKAVNRRTALMQCGGADGFAIAKALYSDDLSEDNDDPNGWLRSAWFVAAEIERERNEAYRVEHPWAK